MEQTDVRLGHLRSGMDIARREVKVLGRGRVGVHVGGPTSPIDDCRWRLSQASSWLEVDGMRGEPSRGR